MTPLQAFNQVVTSQSPRNVFILFPLYKEAYEILKRNFGVQMPLGDRLRLQELEAKIESL